MRNYTLTAGIITLLLAGAILGIYIHVMQPDENALPNPQRLQVKLEVIQARPIVTINLDTGEVSQAHIVPELPKTGISLIEARQLITINTGK